jgi:hypothetical protein
VRQERQDSGVTQPILSHTENSSYVVNLFSLHNYQLIRELVEVQSPDIFSATVQPPSTYTNIRKNAAATAREPKKSANNNTEGGKRAKGMYMLYTTLSAGPLIIRMTIK